MALALSRTNTVARPLATLVPLIKEDIRRANSAGLEYYIHAGAKLREARPQVPSHRWPHFLTTKFGISKMTAWRWMTASEKSEDGQRIGADTLDQITGEGQKQKKRRAKQRGVLDAVSDVDVDDLAQKQMDSRQQEIELHRKLALDLIDIGYKALARKLHPDAGGSRDGMRRLNRVRDELNGLAKTRRFE